MILLATFFLMAPVQAEHPSLIPLPQKVIWAAGSFNIMPNTRVVSHGAMKQTILRLNEALGLPLRASGIGDIELQIQSGMAPEAYALKVDRGGIQIKASSEAGLFYGIQTLRQLNQKGTVPACRIEDAPRFAWRGLMLDDSRHFFPLSFIRKYIDEMAAHKLNTFHWHLTDDGGWRMQVRAFPDLTKIGAWRKEQGVMWDYGNLWFPGPSSSSRLYGGFYTQAELKSVVRYAKERHVTIVPEIEMPGHGEAATASYPELQCEPPADVKAKYLTDSNSQAPAMICPGKDSTLAFYKKVLDETMEVFPSTFIHIGGDEVDKTLWHQCKYCQARMKANGLKNEEELQSWFVRQMDQYLASKGRRLIGWDEILEGGLAQGAAVMSWRGIDGGIAAAKAGHDVVMSPTSHCYFDASYDSTSTEKVYSFEPIPPALVGSQRKRVLGAQANIWTERIPNPDRVEFMTYPRAAALAETLWTNPQRKSWPDFAKRLEGHYGMLKAMNVAFRIPAPVVSPDILNLAVGKTWTVAPPPFPDAVIVANGKVLTHGQIPAEETVTLAYQLSNGQKSETVTAHAMRLTTQDGFEHGGIQRSQIPWSGNRAPEPSAFANAEKEAVAYPTLAGADMSKPFALLFQGALVVTKAGRYTLGVGSDDGAALYLDGKRVLDSDGAHPYYERTATIDLLPGAYRMDLTYFDAGGGHRLQLFWTPPGGTREIISSFRN